MTQLPNDLSCFELSPFSLELYAMRFALCSKLHALYVFNSAIRIGNGPTFLGMTPFEMSKVKPDPIAPTLSQIYYSCGASTRM